MRVPEYRWAAALIGASSIVFTLMPSMFLCGSIGGGVYAVLATWLPIGNEFVGKTAVVAATALGCAFVAWVLCLFLLGAPAMILAVRRRTGGV